jgi:4-hydroxybenzoate polyprenyltransferase
MDAYLRKSYDIFSLTRPMNAVQPLLLVAAGALLAGVAITDGRFYIALVVVLLIHGATTMWNDLEDVVVDKRNHVTTILTEGYVTRRTVWRWVVAQLVIAGMLLYFLTPVSIVGVILLGLLGWQYNAKPLQLSRRPIASMVVLSLSYGLLPLLVGAGQGYIDANIVMIAIAWTISRVSLSLLKDYKDAVGDAKSDKRTFLLVYGHSKVCLWSVTGAVIGNVALLWLVAPYIHLYLSLYWVIVVILYGLIVGWRLRLYVSASYHDYNELFHRCLFIQLLFDGVIVLWLITPSLT